MNLTHAAAARSVPARACPELAEGAYTSRNASRRHYKQRRLDRMSMRALFCVVLLAGVCLCAEAQNAAAGDASIRIVSVRPTVLFSRDQDGLVQTVEVASRTPAIPSMRPRSPNRLGPPVGQSRADPARRVHAAIPGAGCSGGGVGRVRSPGGRQGPGLAPSPVAASQALDHLLRADHAP